MQSSAAVSAIEGAWRTLSLAARRAVGLPAQIYSEDRRVLEQVILPEYARRSTIKRVLFVGCAAYTKHYRQLFNQHEYWTIDPAPARSCYGSERHIVDSLQNLGRHAPTAYFDLIICNGVLGWGLNAQEDAEAAFAACDRHLQAGGELLLGWNDIAPRNRVLPEQVRALSRFEPMRFEPLQAARWRVEAGSRHVFDFYRKPVEVISETT